MMGVQHALGGSAAFLTASPLLDLSPGQVAAGTVLAAGAAMLPDLDQHGSLIGRSFGPLTNVLARLVGAVSGGHRNGTHSLAGLAAFTGLAVLAAAFPGWWRFVFVWLLLGVAVRAAVMFHHGARRARRSGWFAGLTRAAVMAVVTALVLASGVDLTVPLVAGTVLGVASHIGLDMLTPERCPLLWPFVRTRYGTGLVVTGAAWSSPAITTGLATLVACEVWVLAAR